ncbi:hypothetical protein LCGC14_2066750 [marine sediment metagenome]|uniref:10 kDa chaperonin n=1 Tax=marine sediment metagenome TaxID=412755 RepID=A0A0F9HGN2_9ZZZZ
MTLVMVRDKIAVIPFQDPDMIGSLYIPEKAKQRPDQGIVKYRGPKCEHIRVGQHVIFSAYTGTKISVEDEGELYIMREPDVVALMDDEEAQTTFPFTKIITLIDKVEGEMHQRFGDVGPIMAFAQLLKSEVEDQFYSEGLEW